MKVALIGYGEVGRILAEDLRSRGHAVAACDTKLRSAEDESMREHALFNGVTLCTSHADAVRAAELVVSAVTASQTVAVARDCAGSMTAGSFLLDRIRPYLVLR